MTLNGLHKISEEFFYRCAFPRGRMLSKLEDDLFLLVQLIIKHKGKTKEEFSVDFDNEYKTYHAESQKTIQSHRTEMIKLYGLATVTEDGTVQPTLRALRLMETQDFLDFFKIFCDKFQFPNCINKPQITEEVINKNVKFKPATIILKLLSLGNTKVNGRFSISGQEIANLVFNDLRISSGLKDENFIFEEIMRNRNLNIGYEGGSNAVQHGREFLGYMTLAYLLKHDEENNCFYLNLEESPAIEYIVSNTNMFEIPQDFLSDVETRKATQTKWENWYGNLEDKEIENLKTTPLAIKERAEQIVKAPEIQGNNSQPISTSNLKDTGDLGERIVLKYEKENIGKVRPDKVGLVQLVSNDTALGFDIQSLEFADVSKKKLIEVKTTNRTYPPDCEIITAFPMSANEWESARLYRQSYYIYRVFLVSKSVKIYIVNDPIKKEQEGLILLEPTDYRVHLKKNCGSFIEN